MIPGTEANTMVVRVMLADSHTEVRRQLAERLSRETSLHIVSEVSSASELLAEFRAANPEVLLVDPLSRDGGYMSALKQLVASYPGIKIIVLASVVDTYLQVELKRIGVSHILNKGVQTETLLRQIRSLHAQGG